jgi:uncharacterized membrane protein YdjX (TVP38/TMEM64 family)
LGCQRQKKQKKKGKKEKEKKKKGKRKRFRAETRRERRKQRTRQKEERKKVSAPIKFLWRGCRLNASWYLIIREVNISIVNISAVKKILLVLFVSGIMLLIYAGGLHRYFSFSNVRASLEKLLLLYDKHGAAFIAAYAAAYVAVTALSIPAAMVMTLMAGAIFGLPVGVAVVSFASSIGATMACAASRYVFRDWVQSLIQKNPSSPFARVSGGVEREGAFYLFALRLVPVLPFFVVNLAMGLTRMPLRTYYWVSQLGMLPLTLIYVNAGRELSRIDSPAGILSPGVMLSLVLAGVFPIAAKRVLAVYRVKKRS